MISDFDSIIVKVENKPRVLNYKLIKKKGKIENIDLVSKKNKRRIL
jgi:hypothetical protein